MPNDQENTIEVMLNLYSGRPNPTWMLSKRQIEELHRLIEASNQECHELGSAPPGLGYTGFVLTNRHQLGGIPYRLKVYGGMLAMTAEFSTGKEDKKRDEPIFYTDTQGLESWLLEQAREHGYTEAIEKMAGPRF
jgi:hypothetical protein